MTSPLIIMDNIGKTFVMARGVEIPAIKYISLTINHGEFIAIVGPSGSGKSTLMYLIGLLMSPTAGTYHFQGKDVSRSSGNELAAIRNSAIGFVFQSFNLLDKVNSFQNVLLPTMYKKMSPHERRQSSMEKLEMVGLKNRMNHLPGEMSGGEQQRVAIARALVNNPKLILADEPTGNLDSRTGEEIIDIFQRLNERNHTTIIIVTHDPRIADRAERVIRVMDGLMV